MAHQNAFYHSFADTETAAAAVLTLSRVSALTLLLIYLLFILVSIREIRHVHPSVEISYAGDTYTVARTSASIALSDSLPAHRSIRFQDEEALLPVIAKSEEERDSLDMSALGSFDDSHAEPDLELCALEDDPRRQHRMGKTLKSSNSIYNRRDRSTSHGSHRRGASPIDLRQARQRPSFSGSTSSLPRLLLGDSVATADNLQDAQGSEDPPPKTGRLAASLLLCLSAILVAICAEFLVDTLDDIVESGSFLSETFIGLIILPAAGNFAELFTATATAWNGNFDLSIGVSVGSAVQISLFVTPLVVIAGWIMDMGMTIYFDLFGTVALFATTFLVTILILHGKSKFLEGSLLIACYFIIGVGAFLSPGADGRA